MISLDKGSAISKDSQKSEVASLPSYIKNLEALCLERASEFSFLKLLKELSRIAMYFNIDLSRLVLIKPLLTFKAVEVEVVSLNKISESEDRFNSRSSERLDKDASDAINFRYEMIVNLPGFYGNQSVLPSFYTRELIQNDRNDFQSARQFLDFFNNYYFHLYAKQLLEKDNFFHSLNLKDSSKNKFGKLIHSLSSLLLDSHKVEPFLSNANVFSQHAPSEAGLEVLVSNYLPAATPVKIDQLVPRNVIIKKEFQTLLDGKSALGQDTILGSHLNDYTGKICMRIGPLSYEGFESLASEKHRLRLFLNALMLYLNQPLVCQLIFIVESSNEALLELNDKQRKGLGLNSWLVSPKERIKGYFSLEKVYNEPMEFSFFRKHLVAQFELSYFEPQRDQFVLNALSLTD